MSAIYFLLREGHSPGRENKGVSTEELSSRSKSISLNPPLTMLDTVLADTGGNPDPTTKAGRGAIAAGPEPGNAINPDDWENEYRKPPNISPGLIFVRKHFLVGLYMGRLIYGGGLYTDKILC